MKGIYIIKNKIDGKVYVGQSVNLKIRIGNHKTLLNSNKHENTYLQNAYNKYGKENFEFKILEICNEELLDKKERYWISYYDSMNRSKGYNRESGGSKYKHFCKERIESITGEGNPMYGKKQTEETKNKIRDSNRGRNNKLKKHEVSEIKERLSKGEKCIKIAKEFNVKKSTISKINKCINWSWVREDLNEKLLKNEDISNEAIKLFKDGNSVKKISEILKKDRRILDEILKPYKEEKENLRLERNKNIINDFNKGLSKEEIINKYGISKTSYVRIISKSYNENKNKLIQEVKCLKGKGYMNKEIAEKLNLHRTTVTEYLKK